MQATKIPSHLHRKAEPLATARETVRRARAHLSSSEYQCPELRPYEGRPGAMDAFALPSLINGQRRAHRVASLHTEADGRRYGDAEAKGESNA